MLPKNAKKEVLDFIEYLIQKRMRIVKELFETTKETKQRLEELGYTEVSISKFVEGIRDNSKKVPTNN
ncbi:DUF2281 domain-containing protein [Caldanaerobacter subterraneus]|jgi:hypothetical protein|uniref:DUF2281 domain-containing protein n=2 Tax=Caldanaerobacter subterraneus TaxID=911092 RepID=Q8R7P2_CALS4|nr:DUF2281 domain-containing protein [Caldanaerobacter subterraneus]AAM25500.1 hypothetical protein TTE2361 [Caldanaerobacter subterraneus subsp. tengcongensis MB4]MCS3914890.1 hypothetical protein [Caldanaerobacter subterraneus subsp. tengcongensis MB4]TCO53409.1 uncharacterized protein DUF2281 [Caldanaerobacter subterraneus]